MTPFCIHKQIRDSIMAKEIVDAMAMQRALTRITYEIIEKNKGINNLVIVGIKTRGVYIAQRIAERLQQLENAEIPVAELDISTYRHELATHGDHGQPKQPS